MPLDEGIGCLGMLLRGVWVVLQYSGETLHIVDILGFVGSWPLRLLSFGWWKPDSESWEAVFMGGIIIVAVIVAVSLLKM